MQDEVKPNDETFKRFYAAGYQTWREVYECATSSPFTFPSLNMANAFPNHPYLTSEVELDRRSTSVLQTTGQTVWKTTDSNCNLPTLTMKTTVPVTATCATRVILDRCSTTSWNQFGELGGHIPILTLAWAYVLSARWAEIIPEANMEYTTSCAPTFSLNEIPDSNTSAIQLGDVTDRALRWWQAVLAPGEGWNASVLQNNRNLKAPWSVSLQLSENSMILQGKPSILGDSAPPSSITATDYILAYVANHNVQGQSLAAFGAALLLPTQHQTSKPVRWALPHFPVEHPFRGSAGVRNHPPWGRNERQLDKLLTMSCNFTGLQSILSSSFIEPDLPCNICGAWLQGTFEVLDIPSAQEPSVLAQMLMQKSPHLNFLWFGAVLLGMQSHIMKWARHAACLIDLQTAAWTNTFISFLQRSVSVYPSGNRLTRADEARLMFLAQGQHHCVPPLVPFTPFGSIELKDCTLDVQLHATCAGHHGLRYAGMSWVCRNNTTMFQNATVSLRTNTFNLAGQDLKIPYTQLNRDKDCSPSVTRNMFRWLRDADGYPAAEQAIREHVWIADELSSDEESDTIEGDVRSSMAEHVSSWLSRAVTTRSYTL